MQIGILGAATVGQTLASRLSEAGHDATIANSRGPESLRDLVAELGQCVTAGTLVEALDKPVVIMAVPWTKVADLLSADIAWNGRILVDATNIFVSYAPDFEIDDLGEDSGSEIVARLAPTARVVKAFNTLPIEHMFAPLPADGLRRVLFLAGDDAEAVGTVAQLVDDMHLRPIAIGSLASGGRMMQLGGPFSGLELFSANGSTQED
ncbi:NADPH-dependent F420 reductase [Alteraurantiacibacter aquimixticola]|uniref:NADP oxidoreductase n=1 Tax=Alteraurantiacibacter aquimixticola TaxID=2489173 RepID=A0A4T3F1R7_9SPHN|nr:NAD(P)-binding domain-containing protein [Alteraurantiacibacter aquimixticola]TIX51155.1 NADP oxidoreductase [Alteraurantiacibacter aquimixticola]